VVPRQRVTVVIVAKHTGVEDLGDVAEAGDLVCTRPSSEELAVSSPECLFDGEETLALDECAFNLSVVYRWVDGVSDILKLR